MSGSDAQRDNAELRAEIDRTETGAQRGEFTIERDGERIAELTYRWLDDDTVEYNHTWVDPEHRSEGIARALVDEAVDYARSNDALIRPTCPYVARVLKGSDELREMIAD